MYKTCLSVWKQQMPLRSTMRRGADIEAEGQSMMGGVRRRKRREGFPHAPRISAMTMRCHVLHNPFLHLPARGLIRSLGMGWASRDRLSKCQLIIATRKLGGAARRDWVCRVRGKIDWNAVFRRSSRASAIGSRAALLHELGADERKPDRMRRQPSSLSRTRARLIFPPPKACPAASSSPRRPPSSFA